MYEMKFVDFIEKVYCTNLDSKACKYMVSYMPGVDKYNLTNKNTKCILNTDTNSVYIYTD